MIDTVSKNGTFILNIPGKPDGTIDSKEIAVLDGITAWMQVNGEAIYETRPWKVYGEGPNSVKAGSFQGNSISKLGEKDIRFTRNKSQQCRLCDCSRMARRADRGASLSACPLQTQPGKIAQVELIGTGERLNWKQTGESLRVELPRQYRPAVDYAAALKVTLG